MNKQALPQRVPYEATSVVSTKLSPEMRRDLRYFAAKHDQTVSAVIKTALEMYINTQAAH